MCVSECFEFKNVNVDVCVRNNRTFAYRSFAYCLRSKSPIKHCLTKEGGGSPSTFINVNCGEVLRQTEVLSKRLDVNCCL